MSLIKLKVFYRVLLECWQKCSTNLFETLNPKKPKVLPDPPCANPTNTTGVRDKTELIAFTVGAID